MLYRSSLARVPYNLRSCGRAVTEHGGGPCSVGVHTKPSWWSEGRRLVVTPAVWVTVVALCKKTFLPMMLSPLADGLGGSGPKWPPKTKMCCTLTCDCGCVCGECVRHAVHVLCLEHAGVMQDRTVKNILQASASIACTAFFFVFHCGEAHHTKKIFYEGIKCLSVINIERTHTEVHIEGRTKPWCSPVVFY